MVPEVRGKNMCPASGLKCLRVRERECLSLGAMLSKKCDCVHGKL